MKKYLIVVLGLGLWFSNALAQVTITQYNPLIGNLAAASGAISASYSTPYTLVADNYNGLTVTPWATGSLATGTFYDGMSYSGTPGCTNCGTGALAVYLPNLLMQDSLTITGSTGQIIPWTLTLIATPQIGLGANNEITEALSVGGNIANSPNNNQQACFSITGGCGGVAPAGPNNTPFTMTVSGVIDSGGTLTFSSDTTGNSEFVFGPGATFVSSSLALDPLIEFTVPSGITVQSASGVFPVNGGLAVPEPTTIALLAFGLVGLGCTRRRKQSPVSA